LLLFVACAVGGFAGPARAAQDQKQVLVLYSTRRDAQASIIGDRELPRTLERGLGSSIDFYSEYIDLARFSDPRYQSAFSDFIRLKYRDQRFDVLVAMSDVAVEFVRQSRSELFPGVPLVFLANPTAVDRLPNSTGIINALDLASTLTLATALQPDLRHVFVVTGADRRDRIYEEAARAQFTSFEPRLEMTYLAGLATPELEKRLAALPAHSMIYYLVVSRDGAGEYFHPLEYLDRLVEVANAPIYSWVDSTMDRGIVGGNLKSLNAQTEVVGQLAVRVLRGEPADSIAPSSPNLNISQVDWRQLRRWGISESRVPAGTLVHFKELSAWERYRPYILGTAAIIFAQTILIAGLLVQRRRRRQAEDNARASQVALQRSYERIRDLGARLLGAQDAERSRIARELHDDISQKVALLAIDLELLSEAVRPDAAMIEEAVQRTQDIARSVHDLSHRLHPARLRLIGLVSGLEALQRELARPGISIAFTHEAVPPELPPDLTLCIFRIAQEALQNALKYSSAHQISVNLRGGPDELVLEISDDGVGFDVDVAWEKGLGLLSMRERLDAVGGTLKIQSRPGVGTRITIQVPHPIGEPARTVVAEAGV
jgi:signal transduction histidine kinase